MKNTKDKDIFDSDDFNSRLNNFVYPDMMTLLKEEKISKMSKTEKEIHHLHEQLLEGNIKRDKDLSSEEYDRSYEYALDCILFWAVECGDITQEESNELYKKYK